MRAIDTNVAARLVLGDDQAQAEIARSIAAEGILLPLTVILELGWLLESRYRQGRTQVHAAITALINGQGISVHDRALIDWALERYGQGKPLGDMLHVVASVGADSFATFDRALKRQAGANPPVPIEVLEA